MSMLVDANEVKACLAEHERRYHRFRAFGRGDGYDYEIGKAEAYEWACDLIDCIPTVESPKWIPIEERLPESAGFYLITFKSSMGNYIVCEMCYRKNEDNWAENGVKPVCLRNEEILAWMPLPKPYKKER